MWRKTFFCLGRWDCREHLLWFARQSGLVGVGGCCCCDGCSWHHLLLLLRWEGWPFHGYWLPVVEEGQCGMSLFLLVPWGKAQGRAILPLCWHLYQLPTDGRWEEEGARICCCGISVDHRHAHTH